MADLKIAYYGDDFTGSTDVLECLTSAGYTTALFLDSPTEGQLASHPGLEAIGVAGRSRSLPSDAMDSEVRPILTALRDLHPRLVHYKVCSTFDSTPDVGSIGRVIDLAVTIFGAKVIPLLVGAPQLGRWCAFGNLFAEFGIGSGGEVHRLDRHPAMRNHPTTPADESDLRRCLARQTDMPIELFDIRKIDLARQQGAESLRPLRERGPTILLFDVVSEQQLLTIGALIDSLIDDDTPLFSVGSSGIEMALTAHWNDRSLRPITPCPVASRSASPVVIASGSRSPVTLEQIDVALNAGFGETLVDATKLTSEESIAIEVAQAADSVTTHIAKGRSVVIHTGDRLHDSPTMARQLGEALGHVVASCAARGGFHRACIAGGDTSSYAARAMGVTSLKMVAALSRGAPLCRVASDGSAMDGLEMAFKGGQVGRSEFFINLVHGFL